LNLDDLAELKDILETKTPKDIDFLNTDRDIEKALGFINGYFLITRIMVFGGNRETEIPIY